MSSEQLRFLVTDFMLYRCMVMEATTLILVMMNTVENLAKGKKGNFVLSCVLDPF